MQSSDKKLVVKNGMERIELEQYGIPVIPGVVHAVIENHHARLYYTPRHTWPDHSQESVGVDERTR